jgi:hypothetical protein
MLHESKNIRSHSSQVAPGKSPAAALEEQINEFLSKHPDLKLASTQMNPLVTPAEPNAMPRTDESSIFIFCTLFYTDPRTSHTALCTP